MAKTLYLHVGHGKTGTSYLQSVFACSVSALRDQGLVYPWDPSCDLAADAKITSGNGMFFERYLRANPEAGELPLGSADPAVRGTLFSSEWLFTFLVEAVSPPWTGSPWEDYWGEIGAEERVERLVRWAQASGYDRIKVLLFIRNPISQMLSGFQQSIKRAGDTRVIDDYSPRHLLVPRVLACLNLFDRWPCIETDVVNYSVVKDRLAEIAAGWLEIPAGKLVQPPAAIVNRSMTHGELEFQRCLNVCLGPSGELVSDPLCQDLPHIRGQVSAPSRCAQDALWEQIRESVEQVNRRIDPRHRYEYDPIESSHPGEEHPFSHDQIRVIATSLGRTIRDLRERIGACSPEHYRQLQTQCSDLQKQCVDLDEHCGRLHEALQELQVRHASLVADLGEKDTRIKSLKAEIRTLSKTLRDRDAELAKRKARPPLLSKLFGRQHWKRRWARWRRSGVQGAPED